MWNYIEKCVQGVGLYWKMYIEKWERQTTLTVLKSDLGEMCLRVHPFFEVDLDGMWKMRLDARLGWKVHVWVLKTVLQGGSWPVQVEVKVTTKVSVENVEIGVADKDQTAAARTTKWALFSLCPFVCLLSHYFHCLSSP